MRSENFQQEKFYKLRMVVLSILFFFIMLALFLGVEMPKIGLDPSWMLAMNEAIAQNLRIGIDTMFTFGPYSSLYSNYYHPASKTIILVAGTFLAFCYGLISALFFKNNFLQNGLMFVGFFAVFTNSDLNLISYPFLLSLLIFRVTAKDKNIYPLNFNSSIAELAAMTVLFSALGLLCIVKNSAFPMIFLTLVICSFFVIKARKFALLAPILLAPIFALLAFWKFAKQDLVNLDDYFLSSWEVIFGYSSSMVYGNFLGFKVILFILIFALISAFLINLKNLERETKFKLILVLWSYFLVNFKLGFTNANIAHELIVFGSLLIALASLPLVVKRNALELSNKFFSFKRLLAIIVVLVVILTDRKTLAVNILEQICKIADAPQVIFSRIFTSEKLDLEYEKTLQKIAVESKIPLLEGTSDIYSVDLTQLISSKNKWSPRPIIQSYSVYSQNLIAENINHLNGSSAPQNILFNLYFFNKIRFPSLDEGSSWIEFLEKYQLSDSFGKYLLLKKRENPKKIHKKTILKNVFALGSEVEMPKNTSGPIFAKIKLQKNLFGKFISIIYRPTMIGIELTMGYGEKLEFEIVPEMTESGFFISPLVINNNAFARLNLGQKFSEKETVRSFRIFEKFWRPISWQNFYELELIEIGNIGDDG